MKTKHFLWALALPAVIAACTNEDLVVTQPQENPALDNRPMAGKVKVDFGVGEVMTRLDENFNFELGDEIGATLMDEYKADGVSGDQIWGVSDKRYDFVNYIQTNYRYTNTDNGWENSNLLCAGNYFFYYPYTATLNTRTAFEKYLNPNQELTANTSAGGHKLVNDNQMYVGYQLVEGATEGSTSVLNVTMQPVFAFPLFTLMCTDSEPVTIQKIALQLQDKSHNLPLVATVQPETNATNAGKVVNGVTYIDYSQDPTLAVSMSEGPAKLDKQAVTGTRQIQVTFPEGTTTKNGQKVQTYMVIPAGKYSGTYNLRAGEYGTAELLIYTNKGVVTADLSAAHENTGSTGSQNNVTNDVALGEVYGDIEKMPNGYRVVNITFDEVAITKPAEFTATSTEDLDTYLEWYAQIGGESDLYVKSTSEKTELSADAVAILAKNKNITLNVLGDITIAEDVASADFDAANIEFLGCGVSSTLSYNSNNLPTGVQTKQGTQTVTNKADINVPVLDKDVTLVNEGTITLSVVANAYVNKFENNGTMNITAPNAQSTVQLENLHAGYFTNNGELNMNGNVKLTGAIGVLNNNEVNILSGAVNGKIANGFTADGESYTNGVINVAEGATWTIVGTTAYNKGIINNNGAISVTSSGKFENFVAQCYGTKGATFEPTINNYGSIRNITNNGIVKMASESASYSTVAITGATGKVDNTICNNQITASSTETIYCEVSAPKTFTEVNEMVANSGSQLVRFVEGANTLTIDATVAQDGTVTGSIIIADQVEIVSDLTIATENANAKARIYGSGTTEELQITIGEDATATLGNGVKLHVGRSQKGTEVTADGTLKVTANAYLTAYDATDGKLTIKGNVENYGQIAGTVSQYVEGTIAGWTGNSSSTTAISFN